MSEEQKLAIREAVAIAFCNEEPTYEAAIKAAKESGLMMGLNRNRIDVERVRYEVILEMV